MIYMLMFVVTYGNVFLMGLDDYEYGFKYNYSSAADVTVKKWGAGFFALCSAILN